MKVDNRMKTSLVMAVYNGEKYILEQIETLNSQTRKLDEVIFLDDCSSDSTVEIINNYITANEISNWSVFRNPNNQGWEKNFFDGIKMAKNDVIFLSDQDDIWHADKVEKMMNAIESNSNIGVLVCGYNQFDNSGKQIYLHISDKSRPKIRKIDFTDDYYYTKYPGCSMAFLNTYKQFIEACWFEKTPHDGVIWAISNLIGELYLYDEVLFEQRRDGNNASLKIAHDYKYKLNDAYRVKRVNDWYRSSEFFNEEMKYSISELDAWANLRIKLLEEINPLAWIKLFRYKSYYHSNRQYIGDIYYFYKVLLENAKKKTKK